MKHALTGTILLLLAAAMASEAAAQQEALVKLTSEVLREEVVVNEGGTSVTRLVPVSSAIPGEILTITVSYTNEGEGEAAAIVLTNPVPAQMVYVGGSAEGDGAAITYSADGGKTYGASDTLMVTGEDGRKRKAVPSDYTHIRWHLSEPLPAGGSGTVSFKAGVK